MAPVSSLKGKSIALIVPFKESTGGGIDTYVQSESKALEQLGASVYIIRPKGKSKAGFITSTLTNLRKISPDVVHAHAQWYSLLPAVNSKAFRRFKLFFTFHSWDIEKAPKKSTLKTLQFLLPKCNKVSFVCEAQRNKLSSIMKLKGNTIVIPPGITPATVDDIPHDEIVISHLGRFDWKKKTEGVKLLIDAFSELDNAILMIAGKGKYEEEIKNHVAESPKSNKIEITGHIDNKWEFLAKSDIYAHITMQDWMPLSVIEAMHAGKGIVASNEGGIPEALGGAGLIVENNIDEISAALRRLINSEAERVKMGEALKLRAEKEYSIEAFSRRLEEAFS